MTDAEILPTEDVLNDLDFQPACQLRWGRWVDGVAVFDEATECGRPAVADAVCINTAGNQIEKFICKDCLSEIERRGQLIYAHPI